MVTGQGAVGGGGVAGIVVHCSTIVVLVVVNHHHDLKSTHPKFFARPKFYPTGPLFLLHLYTLLYTVCVHYTPFSLWRLRPYLLWVFFTLLSI